MRLKRRSWTLVEVCLAGLLAAGAMQPAAVGAAGGQSAGTPAIATTTVTDTVYQANGSPASGTVLISWPAFVTASGVNVPAGTTSVTLGANGALNVPLVPNAGSTPMGSYYTVVYHLGDGSTTRQYWVVPATPATASGTVTVAAISTSVLPASVAMQTVSKAYVDSAITAAVTGHPLDTSSPYVLITGDTMTGPLVLPGDPTAPLQAADMQYVNEQVSGLAAGLGQKVSTGPQATQVVTQPAGTDLEVNRLNGTEYASQYVSGAGNNGIANATHNTDCTSGCDVVVEHSYRSAETVSSAALNSGTRLEDRRSGRLAASSLNALNPTTPGDNSALAVDAASTLSAAQQLALNGAGEQFSTTLELNNEAYAGGNNSYPVNVEASTPYFKSTYSALTATGTNFTEGQHNLFGGTQNCYGVGDCLMGGYFLNASGGERDVADEGAHPFDLQFSEDARVFRGTCGTGCTTGATSIGISPTANAGTQGEGRYLIDTNPAKVLSSGTITGGSIGARMAEATFSGTSFPLSVFLETAQTIPSQANNIAPGTVSVPIVTSGVPAGYATSTAALPGTSGVACVADSLVGSSGPAQFETAAYTVVDASHVQLTLVRPHPSGAAVAVGGLCGYGLEQKVDTMNGIRQVFPVIGSDSPTSLQYAGSATPVVGVVGQTSAFTNISLVIAAITRNSNVVTVTTAGSFPQDLNGLTVQVQGVADASYNGSFAVTTTSANTFTYANNGANSTSAGGTISFGNGSFALYPMAEVLQVFNPATKQVDGQMTLAANTVNWAAGDAVEEPHYFQEKVAGDTEFITQYVPRPIVGVQAGLQFQGNVGPGLSGWVINNAVPAGAYFGNGGTHSLPGSGFALQGPWSNSIEVEAGEQSVLSVHCNLHGCGTWNSGYNLAAMDSNHGRDSIYYQPQTSALTVTLNGTSFGFTPQGLTAGTINVTNLNAANMTGKVAASALPLFGGSGAAHAQGAVPDPGTSAGTTRYLREDGTWTAPAGGNLVSSLSGYSTTGPVNLPERASLLGEYLLTEGTGTVAHDTSGSGNDGTIAGAPGWDGATDLDFAAGSNQYIAVPPALNPARTWQIAVYNPVFAETPSSNAPTYAQFGINPSLLCGTTNGQVCLIENSTIFYKSLRFMAYNTDHTEAGETLPVGWHVVTLICGSNVNGVVTKTHLLYDGEEVGSYIVQGDAGTCPVSTSGNYQIGGSSFLSGTWFTGKIAAAWAWNKALTLQEGSAAAASALEFIRSKGAPRSYRAATAQTPVIVAGLDSRTYGVQLTPTTVWPATMQLTDSTYARVNLGTPGQTAFDACAMFELSYGLQVAPNSGPVITMLWGGVNDFNHASAQQIADSLRCMVQKAKKLGSRVVLATEISSFNATIDPQKDALDLLLRAQAYGWGVDNLADLATDPHLGPDGASTNTACFPDTIHPGPGCEPYVTNIMQNAANELIGSTESNRHTSAAASYQEVAGDRFLDLTGTSAQTVSLPDCIGYSLKREIVNLGTSGATVSAINGETLAGSPAIGVNARATFVPIPGPPASGGCRWERTQ